VVVVVVVVVVVFEHGVVWCVGVGEVGVCVVAGEGANNLFCQA
jgi:hypothetical protein